MEHFELTEHTANRPKVYTKMEGLVREMQDPESGVPVRSQKLFLTSIPAAFMGYDLIEWLMERLSIEDSSEAVHLANLLCQSGYFFPVTDNKTLTVKDDSSLYRFQTPYYWPSSAAHGHSPDNLEYAIYLAKRSLRNKQRHGLEDYELEALNNLKKTLQNKWDFVIMQAEEQVRLAKDRKKGDKIVTDSQERAYWRVYRPPPGCLTLEILPLPLAACRLERQQKVAARGKTVADAKKEVQFLQSSSDRTRVKTSVALDSLVQCANTYLEYDPFLTPVQPSNPWHSDDPTFWQINSILVEVPTERRVRRWGLSMEELVSDPTGLQEFTNYLRKEYSHENIRFWTAVNDLRRSSQSQIQNKVKEIYAEFLAAGAPCEVNIDGKTMEKTQSELKTPSRFAFDYASDHVYTLLLKKDCYPRFIRSEHFKALLAAGVQPSHKKRFFNFGGPTKKKTSTSGASNGGANNVNAGTNSQQATTVRGSSHDLARGPAATAAVAATAANAASAAAGGDVLTPPTRPHGLPGSLSHTNVTAEMRCETPYRGDLPALTPSISNVRLPSSAVELRSNSKEAADDSNVCPWDVKSATPSELAARDDVCPWDDVPTTSSSQHAPLPRTSSEETAAGATAMEAAVGKLSSSAPTSSAVLPPVPVPVKLVPVVITSQPTVSMVPEIRVHSVSSIDEETPEALKQQEAVKPVIVAVELKKGVQQEPLQAAEFEQGKEREEKTEPRGGKAAAEVASSSSAPPHHHKTSKTADQRASTSAEPTSAKKAAIAGEKSNEVCPWEDEEACNVDTNYVKTYSTLGYL
ncbi:regulator of G-protein signaling 7 isoform X1 [Cloeon dipterum]|uniref:regulator of G-protein signaling 7 isoform X1 n=2 Tax=Cloeon dipterum TaxID=197152 RepID=UPI00321F9CD8